MLGTVLGFPIFARFVARCQHPLRINMPDWISPTTHNENLVLQMYVGIMLRNLMTILYWNAGETKVYTCHFISLYIFKKLSLTNLFWSNEYINNLGRMKISLRCVALKIYLKFTNVLFNLKLFRIFLFHSKPFSLQGWMVVTIFSYRLNWSPYEGKLCLKI